MHPDTPIDRLHARAEGRLAPAEEAELERELAADPALRALAEDYRFVHALTALEADAEHSRLAFEALSAGPGASSLRRAAAAAAVLLLAGAAFFAGRASRGDDTPVYLRAIALRSPLTASPATADLPADWVDYDPRGGDHVRFLRDRGEAEELAAALARPLLVYGSYPGCPLCAELDRTVFSDPAVIELAERFVPVRLDLSLLPEEEQRSLTARGYPFLEVWRADGRTAHALVRRPDPRLFVESLHDGLEKSDATGEQPPWEELRAEATRFAAAETAENEGRLAEAEAGYRALASEAGVPEVVATRAQARLAGLAEKARELLLEARTTATGDVPGAVHLLERARERFLGTSFEADFETVRAALAREGRFPALAQADDSR
jgi:hypothetical protein